MKTPLAFNEIYTERISHVYDLSTTLLITILWNIFKIVSKTRNVVIIDS